MKSTSTRSSIRKKLTLWIILMLVLVSTGVGSLAYLQASSALRRQLEETAPQSAEYGAAIINSTLDGYLLGLKGIANREVIKSMDWELQAPALIAETKRMGFLGMGIIMPNGTALYPDGTQAKLGDRDYFKKAMDGESNYSNVIISRVTNSPVMIVVTPIWGQGRRPEAVLLARLEANWLSDI